MVVIYVRLWVFWQKMCLWLIEMRVSRLLSVGSSGWDWLLDWLLDWHEIRLCGYEGWPIKKYYHIWHISMEDKTLQLDNWARKEYEPELLHQVCLTNWFLILSLFCWSFERIQNQTFQLISDAWCMWVSVLLCSVPLCSLG